MTLPRIYFELPHILTLREVGTISFDFNIRLMHIGNDSTHQKFFADVTNDVRLEDFARFFIKLGEVQRETYLKALAKPLFEEFNKE